MRRGPAPAPIPAHTHCWCRCRRWCCRSHLLLLLPEAGPNSSVLSAGVSGSCWPQSPLTAPPSPCSCVDDQGSSHRSHPLMVLAPITPCQSAGVSCWQTGNWQTGNQGPQWVGLGRSMEDGSLISRTTQAEFVPLGHKLTILRAV